MKFNPQIFCEIHVKYKVIDFVSSKKSIMANQLPLTNLDWFLRNIKSPLTRL